MRRHDDHRILPTTPTALALAVMALPLPGCSGDDAADDGAAQTTAADDGPATGADDADTTAGDAADATGADGSDGSEGTGGADDDAVAQLFAALPGLWTAPVTSDTVAGDFPLMAMDIRPADDRTLFGRVDLDADNNLRFAFAVETHEGVDEIVFRNGGDFLGVLRDTRTRLVEHDADAGTWRFCAVGSAGCDYVDATFTIADDMLDLDVQVLLMHHMHWAGALAEPRPQPGEFPADPTPGSSDDPFPPMPQLDLTVTFNEPAAAPLDAWVVLVTEPCGINPVGCNPSRYLRAPVGIGDTSVTMTFEQIHAGDYFGLAILDRNGSLGGTLLPDAGDGVSLPDRPVTVATEGTSTATIAIVADL